MLDSQHERSAEFRNFAEKVILDFRLYMAVFPWEIGINFPDCPNQKIKSADHTRLLFFHKFIFPGIGLVAQPVKIVCFSMKNVDPASPVFHQSGSELFFHRVNSLDCFCKPFEMPPEIPAFHIGIPMPDLSGSCAAGKKTGQTEHHAGSHLLYLHHNEQMVRCDWL